MGMSRRNDKRLKAIQILKERGEKGISIKELSIILKNKTANVNVFNTDDMIYEDKRNDGLYLVWCGKE